MLSGDTPVGKVGGSAGMEGRKGIGQREKRCTAVPTQASADSTESSGTGRALKSCLRTG